MNEAVISHGAVQPKLTLRLTGYRGYNLFASYDENSSATMHMTDIKPVACRERTKFHSSLLHSRKYASDQVNKITKQDPSSSIYAIAVMKISVFVIRRGVSPIDSVEIIDQMSASGWKKWTLPFWKNTTIWLAILEKLTPLRMTRVFGERKLVM